MALALGPVDGVIPQVRSAAESEQLHGFRRHPAFGEVIAGDLAAGFIGQRALPALGYLLVDLQQPFLEMPRLLLPRVLLILERNFRPVRQPAHRLREVNVLVFLDEGEHVAALMTAEAMEDLAMGVDVEARRLLLVKRAERDEVGSGSLERQVRPDHIHDVAGSADLFAGRGRKQASHNLKRNLNPGLGERLRLKTRLAEFFCQGRTASFMWTSLLSGSVVVISRK